MTTDTAAAQPIRCTIQVRKIINLTDGPAIAVVFGPAGAWPADKLVREFDGAEWEAEYLSRILEPYLLFSGEEADQAFGRHPPFSSKCLPMLEKQTEIVDLGKWTLAMGIEGLYPLDEMSDEQIQEAEETARWAAEQYFDAAAEFRRFLELAPEQRREVASALAQSTRKSKSLQ